MSDQVTENIKNRIDIVEVIGEHLQLKRAGVNFKGLCPFHNEKTPSFIVNRDKGFWHCFGCSEGGDVFSFLQKYEGLSFPEALKILADRSGVKLPERNFAKDVKDKELRQELFWVNSLASKFYHQALLSSKAGVTARNYLKDRGFTEETIKQWQLGFAPDDWHQLDGFLQKKGVAQEKGLQAGLLSKNAKGQVYDRFRFRIIFPLFDNHGRIAGFTARTLSDDKTEAKYINTPETLIYHKGSLLYGYNFAKDSIRKEDRVVVVEGNTDVIASHQAGVSNVVASSGTALTTEQLNLIKRMTRNIVFAFDADTAGLNATWRGISLALQMNLDIKIAKLPKNEDPDSLIKKDINLWKKLILEAPEFLDFAYEIIFSNIKKGDKTKERKASQEYLKLVGQVKDPILQAQEAKKVAERLSVPVSLILDEIKIAEKDYASEVTISKVDTDSPKPFKTKQQTLEEKVLGLAAVNNNFLLLLKENLNTNDFEILSDLAAFIFKKDPKQKKEIPNDLKKQYAYISFLGEEDLNQLKLEYTEQSTLERQFLNLCYNLKSLSLKTKMQSLSFEIAQKEKQGKREGIEELQQKFNKISSQLSNIAK